MTPGYIEVYPPGDSESLQLAHGGQSRAASESPETFPYPKESGAPFAGSIWEFPKIRGTLFWGRYNKDPTI